MYALQSFLIKHVAKKGEPFTHTSMGGCVGATTRTCSTSCTVRFTRRVGSVFMTEKHLPDRSPILIDLDLRRQTVPDAQGAISVEPPQREPVHAGPLGAEREALRQ